MNYSPTIAALAASLAKAQGAIRGASKDRINPHFKAAYADLASVWDACRAPLAANGIAVIQGVEAEGATVLVTTTLAHASGEWMSSTLALTAAPATPQGIGSAITYGRRYGLSAMVGIAPEDDDGNAASEREPAPPARGHASRSEPPHPPPSGPPPSPPTPGSPPASKPVNPAHVVAAFDLAKRIHGNKDSAAEPWKVAVQTVIGSRPSSSMTEAEALDVEAILKEGANAPGVIPF